MKIGMQGPTEKSSRKIGTYGVVYSYALASLALLAAFTFALFTVAARPPRWRSSRNTQAEALRAHAMGPLAVSRANPIYFVNPSGKAVYLTGTYVWSNGAPTFDFQAYLDLLVRENQNFIRLWHTEENQQTNPYLRTGPGNARDGKPRYDLTQFDPSYFDHLRAVALAAQAKGIYVGVMLFNGWSVATYDPSWANPWPRNPFHSDNNVNDINGDPDGDGMGQEIHSLAIPGVTKLEDAYVEKVVDALNDLDNVIWEVCNECDSEATRFQYHMIGLLHEYEATKPKHHPVWMTAQWPGGDNAVLSAGDAEAVSPTKATGDYLGEEGGPDPNDGRKVILTDTDHLWGIGGNVDWVWRSFTRGLNPIFLEDDLLKAISRRRSNGDPIRRALGETRAYAQRMDLIQMRPHGELTSTGYALARPGREYLVYSPVGGRFSVDLKASPPGPFQVEWLSPGTGGVVKGPVVAGNRQAIFTPPFHGPAVLYLLLNVGIAENTGTGD